MKGVSRAERFYKEIEKKPFSLLEDCFPYEDWLNLGRLSFPAVVKNKIDGLANKMIANIKNRYPNLIEVNAIWKILDYKEAWGANINLDYFSVRLNVGK